MKHLPLGVQLGMRSLSPTREDVLREINSHLPPSYSASLPCISPLNDGYCDQVSVWIAHLSVVPSSYLVRWPREVSLEEAPLFVKNWIDAITGTV